MAKNRETKLAQDFTGLGNKKTNLILSKVAQKKYSNGLYGTTLIEPVPNYHKATCEIVNFDKTGTEAAQNNCWIILGRDRETDILSGYGGSGHTQSGAIYICAGMSSAEPYEEQPPQPADRDAGAKTAWPGMAKDPEYQGTKLMTERSFSNDASFIYLSQKCSLDDYLELGGNTFADSLKPELRQTARTDGFVLKMTKYNTMKAEDPRSGIGIKSDNVRVVGRESIRLQIKSERHSQGNYSGAAFGISFVGGGDATKTEPLVKGYKLIGSFEHLKETMDVLAQCLTQFMQDQTMYNMINANHVHVGFGGVIASDPLTPIRMLMENMAIKTFSISYAHLNNFQFKMSSLLSNYTKPSTNYILSQNVFCD